MGDNDRNLGPSGATGATGASGATGAEDEGNVVGSGGQFGMPQPPQDGEPEAESENTK